MTTWFVSRHEGALQWMLRHGPAFDRHVRHLDLHEIEPGDRVIGTLPVNLAAHVCARAAQYWNLSVQLDALSRGMELSCEELERLGARIERFNVAKVYDDDTNP